MEENHFQDSFMAVLIDADNVSYKNLTPLMEEVSKYGVATVKRIYGDWTQPNLTGWKSLLQDYAIIPIQQFGYTTGKNSTDSALIIDAMDLLYTKNLDGFCLVSSDSDFTRLATRLREAGKFVYGFGEKKTPKAFIAACDRFFFLEVLERGQKRNKKNPKPRSRSVASSATSPAAESENTAATMNKIIRGKNHDRNDSRGDNDAEFDDDFLDFIYDSIEDLADDQGWVFMADIGNLLVRKNPSFDPRNYGYSKLTPLIRAIPGLEIQERNTNKPNIKHIYVRIREY